MSAVLPEAKVTLTDERTSVVRSHETNGSGFYDFEALPSSEYTVLFSVMALSQQRPCMFL